MKKLAIILGLVAGSAMAATPQQFYRAEDGKNLIEAGWMMNTLAVTPKGGDETKTGITSFDVTYSRGLNKDMAVGISTGNQTQDDGGGMKDINLFVEGQKDKVFYGLNVAMSGDKETDKDGADTNAKSGGMNYTLTLGYGFMDNAGVRLDYTPGFTSTTKPDSGSSTETDLGADMWIQLYYEHMMGENTLGAALGQYTSAQDDDNSDDDQTWTTIEVYYVHGLGGALDLTAGLRHHIGSVKDVDEVTKQGLDLGVRYRF